MAISYESWLAERLKGAATIADGETQLRRWLAPDAAAWERPVELLCVLLDDLNLELFIEQHRHRFSEMQLNAATALTRATLRYDCGPTGWRNPQDVLADPVWEDVWKKAKEFISAFDHTTL